MISDPCFYVILVEPGPNRLAVIVRVRHLLGLPLVEARRRVDAGEVVLAEGDYMDKNLRDLRDEFISLGAVVTLCEEAGSADQVNWFVRPARQRFSPCEPASRLLFCMREMALYRILRRALSRRTDGRKFYCWAIRRVWPNRRFIGPAGYGSFTDVKYVCGSSDGGGMGSLGRGRYCDGARFH